MLLGLDRVREALARLGDPHAGLVCAHVAGSNGKGSTSAMVESIARAAGLRTGLYTSPHLSRFAERIRIGGEPIADDAFDSALGLALGATADPSQGELTFFEVLTIAAFVAFRDAGVDVAVLEVGLGGRLDATNVIEAPLATAITSIALEHTEVLGATEDLIAREKAGILKRGAPVILGPLSAEADRAIEEVARGVGAGPVWRVARAGAGTGAGAQILLSKQDRRVTIKAPPDRGDEVSMELGLRGPHQGENAAVAAGIVWRLSDRFPGVAASITKGLSSARWPGRFEQMERDGVRVILDCAHNPHGAAALARTLAEEGVDPGRTVLVFGALADKPFREMLAILGPLARSRYYASPKGRSPAPLDELGAIARGEPAGEPREAVARALTEARPGDTILITGSIYLVGEARAALLGEDPDPVVAL
jgi:dihydrofolate synthase/folylpolyglutamate synthase